MRVEYLPAIIYQAEEDCQLLVTNNIDTRLIRSILDQLLQKFYELPSSLLADEAIRPADYRRLIFGLINQCSLDQRTALAQVVVDVLNANQRLCEQSRHYYELTAKPQSSSGPQVGYWLETWRSILGIESPAGGMSNRYFIQAS